MIQRKLDGEGPDTLLAKQYDHQLRKSVAVDHASEAGIHSNESRRSRRLRRTPSQRAPTSRLQPAS